MADSPDSTGNNAKDGSAPKGDRKPTKALPTDRTSLERALAVLRAYGAIGASEGVSSTAVAEVVEAHPSTVSVCNPFFLESGLIERAGVGCKASSAVVAYHAAYEWDKATAAHKLAPVLRETWYWKALAARLSFRAVERTEAVRILAAECGAGPTYQNQIEMIVQYLSAGGLVVLDGSLVRKGPNVSLDTPKPAAGALTPETKPPAGEQLQKPIPLTMTAGIVFDASIRVSEAEIGGWSPEQIEKFFAGLAAVISAKARANKTE